jgi:hypothetical protein
MHHIALILFDEALVNRADAGPMAWNNSGRTLWFIFRSIQNVCGMPYLYQARMGL